MLAKIRSWFKPRKAPEKIELLPPETIAKLNTPPMICYYVVTSLGAGLRVGKDEATVRTSVEHEIGPDEHIKAIRIATADDANWIAFMGGHLPSEALDL